VNPDPYGPRLCRRPATETFSAERDLKIRSLYDSQLRSAASLRHTAAVRFAKDSVAKCDVGAKSRRPEIGNEICSQIQLLAGVPDIATALAAATYDLSDGLQHRRCLAGRDTDKKSVCDDKLDWIAGAKADAGEANTTQSAECGWSNHFGFSSENTLDVLARASLFTAFRARLEYINASRHAFKTAKNCLISFGADGQSRDYTPMGYIRL
jgi:hypothetical protein